MSTWPTSPATERNRGPILEVLLRHFADRKHVLELGSGTGEHAVFFAGALPHLLWQPSDMADHVPMLQARVADSGLSNLLPPLELDGRRSRWPIERCDAVFCANVLHIAAWPSVEKLFEGIGRVLASGGVVAVYGPFRQGGHATAPSNAVFDDWLRARDPDSGVRDIEAVFALAESVGLSLREDVAMPANNRCLLWHRAVA